MPKYLTFVERSYFDAVFFTHFFFGKVGPFERRSLVLTLNFNKLLRHIVIIYFFDFLVPHDLKSAINHVKNVCCNIHLVVHHLIEKKIFLDVSMDLLLEMLLTEMLHLRHVLEEFNLFLVF